MLWSNCVRASTANQRSHSKIEQRNRRDKRRGVGIVDGWTDGHFQISVENKRERLGGGESTLESAQQASIWLMI